MEHNVTNHGSRRRGRLRKRRAILAAVAVGAGAFALAGCYGPTDDVGASLSMTCGSAGSIQLRVPTWVTTGETFPIDLVSYTSGTGLSYVGLPNSEYSIDLRTDGIDVAGVYWTQEFATDPINVDVTAEPGDDVVLRMDGSTLRQWATADNTQPPIYTEGCSDLTIETIVSIPVHAGSSTTTTTTDVSVKVR